MGVRILSLIQYETPLPGDHSFINSDHWDAQLPSIPRMPWLKRIYTSQLPPIIGIIKIISLSE